MFKRNARRRRTNSNRSPGRPKSRDSSRARLTPFLGSAESCALDWMLGDREVDGGQHSRKPAPPAADRLAAHIDPALMQQVASVPHRQRQPHIHYHHHHHHHHHHNRQANDLGRRLEVLERAAAALPRAPGGSLSPPQAKFARKDLTAPSAKPLDIRLTNSLMVKPIMIATTRIGDRGEKRR